MSASPGTRGPAAGKSDRHREAGAGGGEGQVDGGGDSLQEEDEGVGRQPPLQADKHEGTALIVVSVLMRWLHVDECRAHWLMMSR